MLRRIAACLALLAASCDGSPSVDAGRADSAVRDAGSRRDAGALDAGSFDGGPLDAGPRDAGSLDAGPRPCVGPPGLYADEDCTILAEGVRAYRPRYQLWSDGDAKERFVFLPPGTQIDTSNPDRWGFPVGTRLYKTFARDGVRFETRLLEKVRPERGYESWRMVSFAWGADQRSVTEVGPFGALDVLGTQHDIPTRAQCIDCHSVAQDDAIDGFSAIQLNHDEGGLNLAALQAEGWLSEPIALDQAVIPGNDAERAALGHLHANCGNCHGGPTPEHGLDLWVPIGVTEVSATPTWRTAVCTCSVWTGTTAEGEVVNLRVLPGDPLRSVAIHRMISRVPTEAMPPFGSEQMDEEGIRILSEWISTLDPTANGCPHGCPWP
jgi:hypothetical protein